MLCDMYHHMKTFHRAGEQDGTDQFKEAEKETGRNYINGFSFGVQKVKKHRESHIN